MKYLILGLIGVAHARDFNRQLSDKTITWDIIGGGEETASCSADGVIEAALCGRRLVTSGCTNPSYVEYVADATVDDKSCQTRKTSDADLADLRIILRGGKDVTTEQGKIDARAHRKDLLKSVMRSKTRAADQSRKAFVKESRFELTKEDLKPAVLEKLVAKGRDITKVFHSMGPQNKDVSPDCAGGDCCHIDFSNQTATELQIIEPDADEGSWVVACNGDVPQCMQKRVSGGFEMENYRNDEWVEKTTKSVDAVHLCGFNVVVIGSMESICAPDVNCNGAPCVIDYGAGTYVCNCPLGKCGDSCELDDVDQDYVCDNVDKCTDTAACNVDSITSNEECKTEDCAGVCGGTAAADDCGTCDNDASNDCVQDCAGTWGGDKLADDCGTCDNDASNDCVQDCAGTWGGDKLADNCGTCDADTSNDCVQDCAGTWGGNAVEDDCGVCETESNYEKPGQHRFCDNGVNTLRTPCPKGKGVTDLNVAYTVDYGCTACSADDKKYSDETDYSQCQDHVECPAGQGSTTLSDDELNVCTPCVGSFSAHASFDSCTGWALECSDAQYQSVDPSPTQDRQCATKVCSACADGVEAEGAACGTHGGEDCVSCNSEFSLFGERCYADGVDGDGDGVLNGKEVSDATDPTDPGSFKPCSTTIATDFINAQCCQCP